MNWTLPDGSPSPEPSGEGEGIIFPEGEETNLQKSSIKEDERKTKGKVFKDSFPARQRHEDIASREENSKMDKPRLTLEILKKESQDFAEKETKYRASSLFGVTDGKAIGTYVEHKFRAYLREKYDFKESTSASGIDFPELEVDIKVTSVKQPQSSCPYQSARQKIYGLGYSLLVFVYEKIDDPQTSTGNLNILRVIFVRKEQTGDFQTTSGLRRILDNEGNKEDILAFLEERMLPVDEIQALKLAEEILANPPLVGYLTISNALQWRLQYSRVIQKAGSVPGVEKLR